MDVKQKLESLGVFYTHNERDGTPTDRENLKPVFECVLPPMTRGHIQTLALKKITTAIEDVGGIIHNKCGGHVHFGLKAVDLSIMDGETWTKNSLDYTAQQYQQHNRTKRFYGDNLKPLIMPLELGKAIAKRYSLNQAIINSMLPRSRTNNYWAKPINDHVQQARFKNATDATFVCRALGGKYTVVNFSNWHPNGGTLEFRQAKGSLDTTKINAWIDILENLIITTDKGFMDYSQSTLREGQTPEQPYNARTRLGQIWAMCRTDNGCTISEMMMATGTSAQNIRGRISEMRSRFGQSAIVTSTQQANGHQYRDGDQYAGYRILKTFRTGVDSAVTEKPSNRCGNPSIWANISDDDFEWWQARIAAL